MAKKTKAKAKAKIPRLLFADGAADGRIWVGSGESMSDAAQEQIILETGFRPLDTTWWRSAPLDRLSKEQRQVLRQLRGGTFNAMDGSIHLARRYVTVLSKAPETEKEILAFIAGRIEELVGTDALVAGSLDV